MASDLTPLARTAFRAALSGLLSGILLDKRDDLFNPDNPSPWTGDDAFGLGRQLRRGELRARYKSELIRDTEIVKTRDRPDLPKIFRMAADSTARWLEKHKDDPLPSPELGPDARWPSWARFRVDVDENLLPEFGEETDYFATAQQVADIIEPALQQRLEKHPEDAQRIDRLRSQLRYWIKHDALCPPGEGNTTEIDGYLWDPERSPSDPSRW